MRSVAAVRSRRDRVTPRTRGYQRNTDNNTAPNPPSSQGSGSTTQPPAVRLLATASNMAGTGRPSGVVSPAMGTPAQYCVGSPVRRKKRARRGMGPRRISRLPGGSGPVQSRSPGRGGGLSGKAAVLPGAPFLPGVPRGSPSGPSNGRLLSRRDPGPGLNSPGGRSPKGRSPGGRSPNRCLTSGGISNGSPAQRWPSGRTTISFNS